MANSIINDWENLKVLHLEPDAGQGIFYSLSR